MLLDVMRAGRRHDAQLQAPQWLVQVLDAMAEPPLLGEGLAAMVRLSRRSREYIWRSCKESYGQSPQDLLNELRMAYAERALRISDEPIAHISYSCGYSNISHFYRLFNKSYGQTPARYRRRHQSAIT
jgi:AraC-like DNA-binding protein